MISASKLCDAVAMLPGCDGWTFASTEFPPPTPHQSTVVESYITPNISGTHASPDGHPRAALPNPATTKFGGGMMPTRQSGREKTPRVPCNMAEEVMSHDVESSSTLVAQPPPNPRTPFVHYHQHPLTNTRTHTHPAIPPPRHPVT